uniref:C3H1-type domain-containing protein n=1 Tax=Caenorhabditis japonica TaxID=281687 RepID=A0A8R1HMS6_CAEJA
MHIEKQDIFLKWLADELTPIADADPQALAKYVLALVKKPDKSIQELKEFTIEQLSVFLGDHTAQFVDKIFAALLSKSYLTVETTTTTTTTTSAAAAASAPTASSAAPESTPVESKRSRKEDAPSEKQAKPSEPSSSSPLSTQKPSSSKNDRPARKRISPPPPDSKDREKEREKEKSSRDKNDRRRSRSPRDRRNRQTTSSRGGRASSNDRDRYSRRRSRSRSHSSSRSKSPPVYKSRSRRRCKDFEERGYCIRGEQCPYYHGPDPVVVDENALSTIVPLPAAPPNFSCSLPPPGYNPLNPPPPGVVVSAGEYNPETPALTVTNYSVPPPPIPTQWQQPPPQAPSYIPQPVTNYAQPPPGAGIVAQQTQVSSFRGSIRGRGSTRGARGGMGRGGYGGPINRDNCSLQVAKLPAELNNISKLNEHFGAFGNIENIQVRYNGEIDAALVTFASKFDAQKAYKSPAPVLNNRFIKVFWHKPEGDGIENAGGSKASSTPSPPKQDEKPKIATVKESKFVNVEVQNYRKQILDAKQRLANEKTQLSHLVQLQNQQNILMEKWMTKQKELLVKARTSTDEAEKKNATKLVKMLHKKVKTLKEEIDGILLKISEKSMLVDEVSAQIDSIKNPMKLEDSSGRKRKADYDGDEEVHAKMSSVVMVKDVKEEFVTDLMAHMEKFGEVFDTSVKVDDGLATAVFPFKHSADALKVMAEGKILNGVTLDMELRKEQIEEIPSTDTNMSADQLLASIPSGLESDEEDDVQNE